MNLAMALEIDQTQSQLEARIAQLEATVREQTVYIKQLEACVLSAPIYRSPRQTPAERNYEARKIEWSKAHRATLTRASRDPIMERESYRKRAQNKVAQMKNRVNTLMQRVDAGDNTAFVPGLNDLWAMLSRELATI